MMVSGALRSMEEERRRAHIYPDHVLLGPLQKRLYTGGVPPLETRMAVSRLAAAGKVKIGRTINDWYIRIVDEQGPQ